jgi:hypothetical protein
MNCNFKPQNIFVDEHFSKGYSATSHDETHLSRLSNGSYCMNVVGVMQTITEAIDTHRHFTLETKHGQSFQRMSRALIVRLPASFYEQTTSFGNAQHDVCS